MCMPTLQPTFVLKSLYTLCPIRAIEKEHPTTGRRVRAFIAQANRIFLKCRHVQGSLDTVERNAFNHVRRLVMSNARKSPRKQQYVLLSWRLCISCP